MTQADNDGFTGLRLLINSIEDDFLPYNPLYDYGKSDFCQNTQSSNVPVIKLYCTDEAHDRKCILIMHNIFPYFYVSSTSLCNGLKSIRAEILSVGCLLEKMLGSGSVQRIIACKGTSLYGYWEEETQIFLRISLFNPKHVKRAADLLVKMCKLIVYEVHIPFLLQFMIDFDLAGMDYILVEKHTPDQVHSELLHSWPQFVENRKRLVKRAGKLKRPGLKGRFCGVFLDSLTDFLSNCVDEDSPISPIKTSPMSLPRCETAHSLQSGFGWQERFDEVGRLFAQQNHSKLAKKWTNIQLPNAFDCIEVGFTPLPNLILLPDEEFPFSSNAGERNEFVFSPIEIEQQKLDGNVQEVIDNYEIESQQYQIENKILNETLDDIWKKWDESNSLDFNEQIPVDFDEPNNAALNYLSSLNTLDGINDNSNANPTSSVTEGIANPFLSSNNYSVSYSELSYEKSKLFSADSCLSPCINPPRLCDLMQNQSKIDPDSLLTPNRIQSSQQQIQQLDNYGDLYNLCIFSIELFAMGNSNQISNPQQDPIFFICYGIFQKGKIQYGALKICDGIKNTNSFSILELNTEPELIGKFLEIFTQANPDILIGFEIHKSSWGYLLDRIDYCYSELFGTDCLSRDKSWNSSKSLLATEEEPLFVNTWDYKKTNALSIPGRHTLNVWRILRNEYNFTLHSLEHAYFNLFGKKIPRISLDKQRWLYSESLTQHRTIQYVMERTKANFRFLLDTQILIRSVEFCKFFGINFCHVFSRGSQFKVESLMLRIAKIESFISYSPSKLQVANMKASESIPLVMEPENKYYTSPVVVLDFQSLYPSLMIAYNYCFSTCLGKITKTNQKINSIEPKYKLKLNNNNRDSLYNPLASEYLGAGYQLPNVSMPHSSVSIAPNGALFVSKDVRQGILPKMLSEILQARIQIKKLIKTKSDRSEKERLEVVQLGLKLIANVTFGYTSASYSGRMPMVEVADAIVESGRTTLQNSIRFINQHPAWKAKVVYGDTDSLFVLLEGASKERAFEIGNEIAYQVTQLNPKPIMLRFEKVYHPCILMAKKRYVARKWEVSNSIPVFDAKGIETVRRDSCPLIAKVMEKFLTILFNNDNNVSLGKKYLEQVWMKMRNDYYPISDYIFANEVKNIQNKNGSLSSLVAREAVEKNQSGRPEYGERIPYIVVEGMAKGSRLVDMVISPDDYSPDKHEICYDYYVKKQLIQVLSRCLPQNEFNILEWYNNCRHDLTAPLFSFRNLSKIDSYFIKDKCKSCGNPLLLDSSINGFCYECGQGKSMWKSLWYSKNIEQNYLHYQQVCAECCNVRSIEEIPCIETECRIYWRRKRAEQERAFNQQSLF